MAGDAHEGSTGGVWAEDRCRLGLLHVDRLAWSEDARHGSRNMRVCGAQSQDWQLCRFWISIHLWKEKQGGTFTRDTKHVCLHSMPLGTRRPMPSRKKTRARRRICSIFYLENKRKIECGKRKDINNDPEVSRWFHVPTSVLIIAAVHNIFSSILFGNKSLVLFQVFFTLVSRTRCRCLRLSLRTKAQLHFVLFYSWNPWHKQTKPALTCAGLFLLHRFNDFWGWSCSGISVEMSVALLTCVCESNKIKKSMSGSCFTVQKEHF